MAGILVRPADYGRDAEAILAGARNFISRMDFTACLPEDDAGMADALAHIIGLPGFELTVAEHGGIVVGGVGMLYGPFLWNRAVISATEMFLWDAPGAPPVTLLLLLRAVQRRMAELDVRVPNFVRLTSSPDKIDKIYARMGLRKVQETWAMVA